MKKLCFLSLSLFSLSLSAFASTYTFDESGGSLNLVHSLKFGSALQLTGSKIVGISGPSLHMTASSGGKLGVLKLTGSQLLTSTITGSKAGGSITDTYSYGPGIINIVNTLKSSSFPHGVIFNGTFSTETLTVTYGYSQELNAKGKPINVFDGRTWQLVGNVIGKMYTGQSLSGTFTISRVGRNPVTGTTNLAATPEPGTLLLLATGLLGIAGLVRSRFRSAHRDKSI